MPHPHHPPAKALAGHGEEGGGHRDHRHVLEEARREEQEQPRAQAVDVSEAEEEGIPDRGVDERGALRAARASRHHHGDGGEEAAEGKAGHEPAQARGVGEEDAQGHVGEEAARHGIGRQVDQEGQPHRGDQGRRRDDVHETVPEITPAGGVGRAHGGRPREGGERRSHGVGHGPPPRHLEGQGKAGQVEDGDERVGGAEAENG